MLTHPPSLMLFVAQCFFVGCKLYYRRGFTLLRGGDEIRSFLGLLEFRVIVFIFLGYLLINKYCSSLNRNSLYYG